MNRVAQSKHSETTELERDGDKVYAKNSISYVTLLHINKISLLEDIKLSPIKRTQMSHHRIISAKESKKHLKESYWCWFYNMLFLMKREKKTTIYVLFCTSH